MLLLSFCNWSSYRQIFGVLNGRWKCKISRRRRSVSLIPFSFLSLLFLWWFFFVLLLFLFFWNRSKGIVKFFSSIPQTRKHLLKKNICESMEKSLSSITHEDVFYDAQENFPIFGEKNTLLGNLKLKLKFFLKENLLLYWKFYIVVFAWNLNQLKKVQSWELFALFL